MQQAQPTSRLRPPPTGAGQTQTRAAFVVRAAPSCRLASLQEDLEDKNDAADTLDKAKFPFASSQRRSLLLLAQPRRRDRHSLNHAATVIPRPSRAVLEIRQCPPLLPLLSVRRGRLCINGINRIFSSAAGTSSS